MRWIAVLTLVGCAGGDPEGDGPSETGPLYALGTLVFGPEGGGSYVSLLDSLEPQEIDLGLAREFSGTADMWAHEGSVFVAELETMTITKFVVVDGALAERGVVSFANYGLVDLGFWLNVFVSPNRAYLLNGAAEYVIWDPEEMAIVGSLPLPELEAPQGFRPFPGYADRSALVRDGRMYQPVYFTDDTYFRYTEHTAIVVVDLATETVVDVLEAPCPGLDHGAVDEDGNLWFSSWVYAPGAAAVLDQPGTCIVKIAAGEETPSVAFAFAEITEGREGGAVRPVGGGKAVMSVLHADHAASTDPEDIDDVAFGPNWRLWRMDLATGEAEVVEAFDWSAGAAYTFDIDESTIMLMADGDYASTSVIDLGDGTDPSPLFDTPGWAVRLFRVR